MRVHWFIDKIEIPKEILKEGYDIEAIKQIIKEAFNGYGTRGIERSKLLEVTVEINTEPEYKERV